MPEKPPVGALPEEERLKMKNHPVGEGSGWYAVDRHDGSLLKSGALAFIYEPRDGYYFKNFWHAYAYHLRVLKELEKTSLKND